MKNFLNEKFVNSPLSLVGLTIVLLTILSVTVTKEFSLFSFTVKPITLFEDVKKSPVAIENNTKTDFKVLQASVGTEGDMKDFLRTTVSSGFANSEIYVNLLNSIEGNVAQMATICRALKNSRNEQARIAYYGDSFLEGDNICADLRDVMQDKFGGGGVGFVSINNKDVAWRSSSTQTFSNDWQELSVLLGTPREPMGISGYSFKPKANNSWMKLETTWRFKNARDFNTVRLLYSDAKASNIKYNINNEGEKSIGLTAGGGIKELRIPYSGAGKTFWMSATEAYQGYFYGVSLEKGNGVYVDNFPLRGNDGTSLGRIEQGALKGFTNILNYKLIVLHFGLNVLSSGRSIPDYKNNMINIVNHLKGAFPGASILIIGAADKIESKGTQFVPNENVATLVQAQKDVANATGVAFWDLFNSMGGKGSMIKWFQASPQLALSDNHLTAEGSKKVGIMIADALIATCNGF